MCLCVCVGYNCPSSSGRQLFSRVNKVCLRKDTQDDDDYIIKLLPPSAKLKIKYSLTLSRLEIRALFVFTHIYISSHQMLITHCQIECLSLSRSRERILILLLSHLLSHTQGASRIHLYSGCGVSLSRFSYTAYTADRRNALLNVHVSSVNAESVIVKCTAHSWQRREREHLQQ